jgi:glutathione S-transferase
MMKLYYASGACSFAVHTMLIESGAKFEVHKIDLQKGEGRTPEFLKLNSRGQIPVLVDGDLVIREGAAILNYLAEKFNSPLMPKSGATRVAAMEWMMFANATLHPAYSRCYFMNRQDIDAAAKAKVMDACCASVQALWDDVEAQLNKGTKYIAGNEVTIGDTMLCVMANWGIATPPQFGPKTKALIAEVSHRPSYQAALAAEGVDYKAAA